MAGRLQSRFELVQAYFSAGRNFSLSPADLWVNGVVKLPCTSIGPRFIEAIESNDDPDFLRVKLKQVSLPLYWPRTLPLFDLYKVVTECFYEPDWHFYEIPETRVEPGDTVLDCGAAEGIFTLRVSERAGTVIAFEPLPLFTKSLCKTFATAGNVVVEPYALGEVEGQAYLQGGSLYGSVTTQPGGAPIQIKTIDHWAAASGRSIQYIKGDLEGFELKVLQGAAETIRRDRPKIALTVYHIGNNWQEILAYLRKLVPTYQYKVKGLSYNGGQSRPTMLHCWNTRN